MNASSNSTKLLNCLIALSTKNPDFPHPFFDYGFQLEALEPRILLTDGKSVNPDIQFKRNNDLLLLFECKDGHCEKDQLQRYKSLTIDQIKTAKITSIPSDDYQFELSYFCSKEKESKLLSSVEFDDNIFPIITLGHGRIYRNTESNPFNDPMLNTIFENIRYDGPVPEYFIPFTADDSDEIIIINLLQHFMSRFEYDFTLDELLEEFFSHFIHCYSKKGKGDLKHRLTNIIKKLQELPEFSDALTYKKSEARYYLKPSGPKKFRNACIKCIEKLEEDIKPDEEPKQVTLFDFGT